MITKSLKFRFKETSGDPQCSDSEMLAELNLVDGVYIATIEGAIGSQLLKYPTNTPKTTTPVQASPSGVFQECLDLNKSYLLVIMDSSGNGLGEIDKDGNGSWEIKLNGVVEKPQPSTSKFIHSHLFGTPRNCGEWTKLSSVFLRTDDCPQETRWELIRSFTFNKKKLMELSPVRGL